MHRLLNMPKRRKKYCQVPDALAFPSNVRLTVEPDRLEIVYSRRRWGGLFVLVFCSIFCQTIIEMGISLHEWGFREMIAGVVFSSFVFLMFFFVLCCFFHREQLRITSSGLEWRFTAIFPIRHRTITWEELVSFQRGYENGNSGHGVQMIRSWGCKVQTTHREFHIFLDMNPYSVGKAVRQVLQRFIVEYRKSHALATPVKISAKQHEQSQRTAEKQTHIDNRWTLWDNGSGMLIYERRGWVSLKTSASLLAFCLFWNGITSIFVAVCIMGITGWGNVKIFPPALCWFLAIFLIPFILIGLMILSHTLARLMQYFCQYRITLDKTGVHYRRSWFGIGLTRFWRYTNIIQVSVLRNKKNYRGWDCVRNPEIADSIEGIANDSSYAIHFEGGASRKWTTSMIRDLYKMEAHAIAARIRTMKVNALENPR